MTDEMHGTALFSPDERYRYTLTRDWFHTGAERRVVWVMLNPSTADADVLDPTVAKCVRFSKKWGYTGLTVVNLFALRSTDPRLLYEVEDPVGPDNNQAILNAVFDPSNKLVICAWGEHGKLHSRGNVIRAMLHYYSPLIPHALAVNNSGEPKHPLYIKEDTLPQVLNGF